MLCGPLRVGRWKPCPAIKNVSNPGDPEGGDELHHDALGSLQMYDGASGSF
jgi:hypothetical protein